MTTTTPDQKRSRRPRFWVGPALAGACFALGYGITQRVLLIKQAWEKPEQATFRQNSFPGETLDGLRRRYGATQSLMGDVAAKEALDAQQRKIDEQAQAIAKEAQQRDQAKQAAVIAEPVITAAPAAAPNPSIVNEVVSEPAQPAAALAPSPDSAEPELDAGTLIAPEPERPAAEMPEPEPVVSQPRPAIDESLIWQAPPATPPAP